MTAIAADLDLTDLDFDPPCTIDDCPTGEPAKWFIITACRQGHHHLACHGCRRRFIDYWWNVSGRFVCAVCGWQGRKFLEHIVIEPL